MRYIIRAFGFICIFAVSAPHAQDDGRRGKDQYVPVPREIVLPMIAVQPGCPLQIEKVARLMKVGGGGGSDYQLRNGGNKPIKSFTVSYTFGEGTGGSRMWTLSPQEFIAPGQLAPLSAEDSDGEIIPLTDELRKKLGLHGAMKTIVIYMVERVEFADGSVYSDEATATALQSYLDNKVGQVNSASDSPKGRAMKAHRQGTSPAATDSAAGGPSPTRRP